MYQCFYTTLGSNYAVLRGLDLGVAADQDNCPINRVKKAEVLNRKIKTITKRFIGSFAHNSSHPKQPAILKEVGIRALIFFYFFFFVVVFGGS